MGIGIGILLAQVTERLHGKMHLQPVTAGWDRRIGIVPQDSQMRWQLTFSSEGAVCGEWADGQQADLVLCGQENVLRMLLSGDELVYTAAKTQVRVTGTLRDQLKLDTILRLTCK